MSLVLTTPAPDRTLVTLAEAKAFLGVTGNTDDVAITAMVARVSDAIARECRVSMAGAAVPTLRAETLTETFRGGCRGADLVLSRRFVSSITSVVEDGEGLTGSGYELNGPAGLLSRLDGDDSIAWLSGKVVVVYVAGFATVPDDLKLGCLMAIRDQWAAAGREPLVRRETVEGVGSLEFFNSRDGSVFSGEVRALLEPYMTPARW